MKRLLLLCLLIGIGIYLYCILYKNNNVSDEEYVPEIHNTNTHKQNELQQLKSILKQHSNEFINDDFIEQPNIIPEQNPTPTSDKHVHFSEQNEEFVFSKESIINANQLNSDIFMESSFDTDNNINLTLSENEYFSKN
jgi:hypothetical protein